MNQPIYLQQLPRGWQHEAPLQQEALQHEAPDAQHFWAGEQHEVAFCVGTDAIAATTNEAASAASIDLYM